MEWGQKCHGAAAAAAALEYEGGEVGVRAKEQFLVWSAGWTVTFLTEATWLCRKVRFYLDTVLTICGTSKGSCPGGSWRVSLGTRESAGPSESPRSPPGKEVNCEGKTWSWDRARGRPTFKGQKGAERLSRNREDR